MKGKQQSYLVQHLLRAAWCSDAIRGQLHNILAYAETVHVILPSSPEAAI